MYLVTQQSTVRASRTPPDTPVRLFPASAICRTNAYRRQSILKEATMAVR